MGITFGDIIGHSDKERAYTALTVARCVLGLSFILFWMDGVRNDMTWGPSDDLTLMGAPINTWCRYLSLIPFMIMIDISQLLLTIYPKAQLEYYVILPTSEKISDYTPNGLLSMGLQTVVYRSILKLYSWILIYNRLDIMLISFFIKFVIIVFAFRYKISQMTFVDVASTIL